MLPYKALGRWTGRFVVAASVFVAVVAMTGFVGGAIVLIEGVDNLPWLIAGGIVFAAMIIAGAWD